MKNITLFLFAFCLLSVPATACLNYYYTADKDGRLHYHGDEHTVMIGFNTNFNLRRLSENIDTSAAMEEKIAASIALIGRHSNVRPDPEPIGKEGDNLRLGPYTYTEMLDDNSPDKFQIDWTKINTDAVALLNMVGLKPVSDKTDTAAVAAAVVHEGSTVPPDEESGSMWWIVIVVIASCSGLIGVLWYRKR